MRGGQNSWLSGARAWRVGAMLLLLACCGFDAVAQTIVGRISGTVKDATGAVVPGAAVTVTNSATNLVRTATTDEDGFYTVTNLPVGTYSVLAERSLTEGAARTPLRVVPAQEQPRLRGAAALIAAPTFAAPRVA